MAEGVESGALMPGDPLLGGVLCLRRLTDWPDPKRCHEVLIHDEATHTWSCRAGHVWDKVGKPIGEDAPT